MENTRLKLLFIQRVLIDSVGSDSIKNSFFSNGVYPSNEVMESIVSQPVQGERLTGRDWPQFAHTMIGLKRMENLHESLDYVRENNIEGDFIEVVLQFLLGNILNSMV
jgi:hypothetical protein